MQQAGGGAVPATPLRLLSRLYADEPMSAVFSSERTVQGWLDFEAALAQAQAELGILEPDHAAVIAAAARLEAIDLEALWHESRTVGYPIVSLVRQLAAAVEPPADGRVHYGATTQDVMDSGLAVQLGLALDRLEALLAALGDALVEQMDRHRDTVMAARTHGQQAVPTTFGTTLAPLVAELARHRERLGQIRPRACVVSLFGAGGTAAAYGEQAAEVRAGVARRLGLRGADVPWHVARDTVAEFGFACAALAGTCARFARNVVDLSRTEIGEVGEPAGKHRGASSTMPQKVNPIASEAIIGMAATAGGLVSALVRAMEAGHERAAGEWQAEWEVVPQLAGLAAGSLALAGEVARGLRVDAAAMERNLEADGGLLMAEAYMIRLADGLGRGRAHDVVYDAAGAARRTGGRLEDTLDDEARAALGGAPLRPQDYVGDPHRACDAAVALWRC